MSHARHGHRCDNCAACQSGRCCKTDAQPVGIPGWKRVPHPTETIKALIIAGNLQKVAPSRESAYGFVTQAAGSPRQGPERCREFPRPFSAAAEWGLGGSSGQPFA